MSESITFQPCLGKATASQVLSTMPPCSKNIINGFLKNTDWLLAALYTQSEISMVFLNTEREIITKNKRSNRHGEIKFKDIQ